MMSQKPRKVPISRCFPGLLNYFFDNKPCYQFSVHPASVFEADDVKVMSFLQDSSFFKRRHDIFSRIPLFEFNRGRRFTGAVVEHAIDVLDLVDDAAGDGARTLQGMS